MRTTVLWFAITALAVTGCQQEPEQSAAEKRNEELMAELAAKEEFIEEVSSTINEIHLKLEDVWSMEKNILGQTAESEKSEAVNQSEVKQQILVRIDNINAVLAENRKRVRVLQSKLKESTQKYAGLETVVETMKNSLEEREQSIADLRLRVENLEGEVTQKTRMIAVHEATIDEQHQKLEELDRQMNSAMFVMGSSDELKEKGIIEDEGGILWGLIGSTTVLAAATDDTNFYPVDRTRQSEFVVEGTIEEILPKRDQRYYMKEETDDRRTILRVTNPAFWRDPRLVIVTN